MKLIYILLFVIFSVSIVSCDTAWDKYFDTEKEDLNEAKLNLLEHLQASENYSGFLNLMERAGLSNELTKNQVLTLWVVPNELLPVELINETDSVKLRKTMLNHMNSVALYKARLAVSRSIHSMANKVLGTKIEDNIFYIDNIRTKNLNQICTNGVIHEIAGVLYPKMNIYEYMMNAGDNFSVFRDSLNRYNDTVFRPDKSLPIGENEWGNIVYDSVFDITNKYLSRGDIRDEETELTLFLPNNDVIKRMMLTISNYFKTAGREFTHKDTVAVMDWLMRSVLHYGKIENYNTLTSRYSVFNSEWRTDKQFVQEDYFSCSNGNVFIGTSFVAPRKMYMETIEIRPYYPYYMKEADAVSKYLKFSGDVLSAKATIMQNPHEILFVDFGANPADTGWMQFSSIIQDQGKFREIKVMPGTYRLSASFRGYACNTVELYVVYDDNGQDKEELVATFNPGSGATGNTGATSKRGKYEYVPIEHAGKKNVPNGSNGLILDKFEVKAHWGYNPLRFKMVNKGKATRMAPQYFYLDPTDDNY